MESITIAILTVFVFAMIVKWFMKAKVKLPPGPTGLPFIGIGFKIDPRGLHFSAEKWAAEYGSITHFKLFGDNVVILNDYESIYEALVTQSDCFAGRPKMYRLHTILGGDLDLTCTSISPTWLLLRKLVMQGLKMYGTQLVALEEKCTELTTEMLDELERFAETEQSFDFLPIVHRCITSIISSLIFGRKLEGKYVSEMMTYQQNLNLAMDSSPSGMLLDKAPITRFFPCRQLYNRVITCKKAAYSAIEFEAETSKKHLSEENCFIDELLKYQSTNSSRPEKEKLKDKTLFGLVVTMTVAGTSTSTATLYALMAFLVNHPEIQEKIAQEIKEVIGARLPTLQDVQAMPYTEAALYEMLRYHSLLPLNLPHATISNTQLQDYDIPKGTTVFFNFWKLHHDPEYWEEPWEFKPERFIEEGKLVPADHPHRKRLLAFGAGRRACVGEVLAKKRIFLVLTRLLQHFQFLPESEDKRPSHDPRTYADGMNILPTPFNIKVLKRDY